MAQSSILPMFPLNMVILPGEVRTLHIFEPRYKQLIKDCLENDAHFGVPFVRKDGRLDIFGTEVKISKIVKSYPEGEKDIIVEGVVPFLMQQYNPTLKPKLYGAANIERYTESTISARGELFELLSVFLLKVKKRKVKVEDLMGVSIYTVANLFDLTNEERLDLIAERDLILKENMMINKLKLFIQIHKAEQQTRGHFLLN
jgi:Lon protease-like protein